MEINKKRSEYLKGLLIIFLIMIVSFTLVDLYVPIKKLLSGQNLNFNEILSFIKLKQHLPVMIVISIALSYKKYKKE